MRFNCLDTQKIAITVNKSRGLAKNTYEPEKGHKKIEQRVQRSMQ